MCSKIYKSHAKSVPREEKTLENAKEHLDSTSAVELFSAFLIIGAYFSSTVQGKLRALNDKTTNAAGLLKGFKLAVVTCLDVFLSAVGDAPGILDFEFDPDYFDYTHFTRKRGRKTSSTAGQSSIALSGVTSKVNSMISALIRCNSWAEIDAIKPMFLSFAATLEDIFRRSYSVLDSDEKHAQKIPALKWDALHVMWGEHLSSDRITEVYADHYQTPSNRTPEYDALFSDFRPFTRLTRFDALSLRVFEDRVQLPNEWASGYAMTVHESLKQLLPVRRRPQLRVLDEMVLGISDWAGFDSYERLHLRGPLPFPSPLATHIYRKVRPINHKQRDRLSVGTSSSQSPEHILACMGNRARLIDASSGAGWMSFLTVLDGAVQRTKQSGDKARVAIVCHALGDLREDYSLCVFMPAYGRYGISNSSQWWVWYQIANNYSGGASESWNHIVESLRQHSKYLEVSMMYADADKFYDYCEDPGYHRLETEIDVISTFIADIRGAYPELLLAATLSQMNYCNIRLRFKPRVLRHYSGKERITDELDVLGIKVRNSKPTEILVCESKGQGTLDTKLKADFKKFCHAVSFLQANLTALCDELGITISQHLHIRGMFISLVEGVHYDDPNKLVEFYDFSSFIDMLRKGKMPDYYVRFLRKSPFISSDIFTPPHS